MAYLIPVTHPTNQWCSQISTSLTAAANQKTERRVTPPPWRETDGNVAVRGGPLVGNGSAEGRAAGEGECVEEIRGQELQDGKSNCRRVVMIASFVKHHRRDNIGVNSLAI